MQFMILRKADASTEAGVLPDQALLAAMGAYNKELAKAGMMRAGEGLHPSSRGVRVRFSGGKPTVTDGPFTEAKELIAGFTMIEAASREEAIRWVSRWPVEDAGGNAALEIREGGCPGGLRGVSPSAVPDASGHTVGLRRFMILLKANERAEAGMVPDSQGLAAMAKCNEDNVKAGVLLLAEGLKPSSRASRVKFSRGKPSVMDGPFAEAKELLAGFWIIQVQSLQDAVDWALRYPFPFRDTEEVDVEIRPLYEACDFGEAFTPELQQAEERLRAQVQEAGKGAGR
jgi:hypothetical protein